MRLQGVGETRGAPSGYGGFFVGVMDSLLESGCPSVKLATPAASSKSLAFRVILHNQYTVKSGLEQ